MIKSTILRLSFTSTLRNQLANSILRFASHNHKNLRKSELECWNCHSRNFKSNLFICGTCKYLVDPKLSVLEKNYFQLFDLQVQFDIEKGFLEERYKEMMLAYHPDRFYAFQDKKVLKYSENYSSYINQAFNVLKDDLKRAEYYLKIISNKELTEQNIDGDNQDSMKLLQSIMLLREQIEDCQTKHQLYKIQEINNQEMDKLKQQISFHFRQNQLELAMKKIIELKYYYSSSQAIVQKEDELCQ